LVLVEIEPGVDCSSKVPAASGPAVTVGPLQDYLQRVGALNAKAAIYGGISVLLSTLGGIVRSFG
jgi:hypothetical protein